MEAVQSHHTVGKSSSQLICLLNLVDNISKDLDKGYLPGESGGYSESLLNALHLSEKKVQELTVMLGETVVPEIEDLVDRCLG